MPEAADFFLEGWHGTFFFPESQHEPAPPEEDRVPPPDHGILPCTYYSNKPGTKIDPPGRYRPARYGNPNHTGRLPDWLGFVEPAPPRDENVPTPVHKTSYIYSSNESGKKLGYPKGRHRPAQSGYPCSGYTIVGWGS